MERFILIKTKQISENETEAILNLFKDAFGSVKNMAIDDVLIIEYHFDEEIDIKEIVQNIKQDFYLDILVFSSKRKRQEPYFSWVFGLFKNISFSSDDFFLDEKGLVRKSLELDVNEETKKNVLKDVYYDHELINIIRVFLECNMNTSKAADVLYMHRNTLINKLDKFIEITGYDIRYFRDAVIIYSIIE